MTNMPWDVPRPPFDQPRHDQPPQRTWQPPVDRRWSQRGQAEPTVVPTAGVLPGQNLRSPDNWRAALYGFMPVAMAALTTFYLQFGGRIPVYIMIVLAVITPLLSAYNTSDKLRRIVYGVTGLLQTAGFTATLFVGHEAWIPIVSAVIATLSSTLARYYVPTTTLTTPGS